MTLLDYEEPGVITERDSSVKWNEQNRREPQEGKAGKQAGAGKSWPDNTGFIHISGL